MKLFIAEKTSLTRAIAAGIGLVKIFDGYISLNGLRIRTLFSFTETCVEYPTIGLNDGSTKIFFSTKCTVDNVSPDLRAFLDYSVTLFKNLIPLFSLLKLTERR